jgi:acyl-CoA reductase-like NAD-dependent aldehyde dehydrogenase
MVVLADADLERAANGAVFGAFFNSGQICVSVERVYVEDAVHDAFVAKVLEKTRALRVGMDEAGTIAFDYGAMANESQLDIVKRHVADAVAKGATILTGGRERPDGLFYEPTVLVDVDHTMDCMREETFGPTLPIMRVSGVDEAVRLANDSAYGLSASVWTTDRETGDAVASRLEAGAVNVNDVYINLFQMGLPQGGWGESGLGGGRLGGAEGIRKFCRAKAVTSTRIAPKAEVQWYPATALKAQLQARGVRLLGAGDLRRRLGLKPRG